MNRRDNPLSSVNNKEKVYASCKEYDFIRDWIEKNLQGQKRYLYLCAEGRIRNYLFTIERIGDAFKPDFYQKFQEDYLKLRECGEVAETLLSEGWKPRIRRILDNPKNACQKDMVFKSRYLNLIGAYQDIIIYGAGNYGVRAAEMLLDLGVHKFQFCDKDNCKQGNYIMGGRVLNIEEIEKKKNVLIIIAIADERVRREVEQTLVCLKGVGLLLFTTLEKIWKYSVK